MPKEDHLSSLTLSASLRESLEHSTATYQSQLDSSLASYLVGRGIDKDAATGARLGKVCEPLPGHEQYRDRLAVPYLSPAGVVGMRFRCLLDHDCGEVGCPKYLGFPGVKTRMYNVRDLHREEPFVAICEGEMDTLVMSAMVGVPAVGLPGGMWKEHFPRMFTDYPRVFVVMDNDVKEDGTNPGQRFQEKILDSLPQAVSIRPPLGMDVNETFLEYGRDWFIKRMGLT